jgi:hypothetical protein
MKKYSHSIKRSIKFYKLKNKVFKTLDLSMTDLCTVIVVDNSMPDVFSQIQYLFDNNVVTPHKTLVLARLFKSNFEKIAHTCKLIGTHLYFFERLSQIPCLPNNAQVLYPFNGHANIRVLEQRQCRHIFVGHGDSNKIASVHPMLRSYDHVLVAGELARDRLLCTGIFNQNDINSGRVVMVGQLLMNLPSIEYPKKISNKSEMSSYLAWSPTWEGGSEKTNYCSIGKPAILDVIKHFSKILGINEILVDLHPNLGMRRSEYIDLLYEDLNILHDHGIKSIVKHSYSKGRILKELIDRDVNKILTQSAPNICIKHAIVDVSASDSAYISRGITTTCTYHNAEMIAAPAKWWAMRKQSLIDVSERDLANQKLEEIGLDEIQLNFDCLQKYVASEAQNAADLNTIISQLPPNIHDMSKLMHRKQSPRSKTQYEKILNE